MDNNRPEINKFKDKILYLEANPLYVKKSFMGREDHVGRFMYPHTMVKWIGIPRNKVGIHIDIFKGNHALRKELEEETGMNLNGRDKESDLHKHSYRARIIGEDYKDFSIRFNLNDIGDLLNYFYLCAQKDIAPTWESRVIKPAQQPFVFREEGIKEKQTVKKVEMKGKCYRWLIGVQDNRNKMIDYLKVFGERVPENDTIENLIIRFEEIIEDEIAVKKLYKLIEDKNFDLRLFIVNAIDLDEIYRKGDTYYLANGEEIGSTIQDIKLFYGKASNQPLIERIKTKLREQQK